MDEKELEKFDPTVAELTAMVEATKNLTAADLEDPLQLALVRGNRIEFKKTRVRIEKTGKALRENAIAFQRAVIEKEKELIAIIEPEEERLATIESEAKELAIRKDRLEKLPARKIRIETAGYSPHMFNTEDDEYLLTLDANEFEGYFNQLGSRKLLHETAEASRIAEEAEAKRLEEVAAEEERLAESRRKAAEEEQERRANLQAEEERIANERRELDEEKKRLAHEKEVREAEERAKQETEERMKREEVERKEKEAEAAKAEESRIAEEKKAEEAELEKKAKYQAFLKEMGVTKENVSDFHKEETPAEITLYKKVGTYIKHD